MNGTEPEYTNFTEQFIDTLDYIWYTKQKYQQNNNVHIEQCQPEQQLQQQHEQPSPSNLPNNCDHDTINTQVHDLTFDNSKQNHHQQSKHEHEHEHPPENLSSSSDDRCANWHVSVVSVCPMLVRSFCISEIGLPNSEWPSDHCYLEAKFNIEIQNS
jgi:hypothetical protein